MRAMRNILFENPKMALGFAGAVVVTAGLASMGFEGMPSSEDRSAAPVQTAQQGPDAAPQVVRAEAKPRRAAAGWFNDDLADDWHAAPTPVGSDSAQSGNKGEPGTESAVFGEFAPKSSGRANPSPRQRVRSRSGPVILSGAAPGAPALTPPKG